MRLKSVLTSLLLASSCLLGACVADGGTANPFGRRQADEIASSLSANSYQRGPAPTLDSITAENGPFPTARIDVARSEVSGFGGGSIYYPTEAKEGTYAGIGICPGFIADKSAVAWLGNRLASRGFVVFVIDTLSAFDDPTQRGDQLLAALQFLRTKSDQKVRSVLDSGRLGVAGHSMGGGGSLAAAVKQTSLKSVVGLTPWNSKKNWSEVTVPTLIVAAQNDSVAPPSDHARPFYQSLASSLAKSYVELAGASHNTPQSPNATLAKYMIAWEKRFLDNDTRYEPFLCPTETDMALSDFQSTCPYD